MKKYYSFLLIGAALFFFWAAWQTRIILPRDREQKNSVPSVQPGNMPPLVVLTTVALGGFRGLIVDILWMRLISLQKEGKVFEIVQLADWITKLEPQFTTVWAFHAWNMAYNISILYPNPEHRWLWVKNGINLLRDDALKYNPDDPILYRELGWLYQHKIGQAWDDMHAYYKLKLALEMDELFPGPRPDYTKPDSKTKKMREEYKLLPEIMQSIERDYGQLDWRLPETHALYWAYRGRHAAGAGKDISSCDHMIFQSMAAAFRQGRLFMDSKESVAKVGPEPTPAFGHPSGGGDIKEFRDKSLCSPPGRGTRSGGWGRRWQKNTFASSSKEGIYITTPCLDLLPGAIKAYEDVIQRQKMEIFKTAYVNFLAEAVFILHAYGNDRSARKIFDKMLLEAPQLRAQMNFEKYIRDCEQFDIAKLPMADAIAQIEGLLYQNYSDSSERHKLDAAELREKALLLWKQYMDSSENRKKTEFLPPFVLIDEQAKQRRRDRKESDSYSTPQ